MITKSMPRNLSDTSAALAFSALCFLTIWSLKAFFDQAYVRVPEISKPLYRTPEW